jgi:hypothetical protein
MLKAGEMVLLEELFSGPDWQTRYLGRSVRVTGRVDRLTIPGGDFAVLLSSPGTAESPSSSSSVLYVHLELVATQYLLVGSLCQFIGEIRPRSFKVFLSSSLVTRKTSL